MKLPRAARFFASALVLSGTMLLSAHVARADFLDGDGDIVRPPDPPPPPPPPPDEDWDDSEWETP